MKTYDPGMKRLADLVLTGSVKPGTLWKGATGEPFQNAVAEIREELRRVPIIVIDNVAEYFYAVSDKEVWEIEDYPNVAPPFPQFFMEYHRPSRIRSAEFGFTSAQTAPRLAGVMFTALDPKCDEASVIARLNPLLPMCDGWLLKGDIVFESADGDLILTGFGEAWLVSKDGQIQGLSMLLGPTYESMEMIRDNKKTTNWLGLGFAVPLLALSFMNCQNVKVQSAVPSMALSKKHERKTGHPLVKYRVLDIEPMKRVLSSEGGAEFNGIVRALHICRGHFKNLQHDRFKQKGLHWWPAHVRGSVKAGVVVKGYNVKPPKDKPPEDQPC